MTTLTRTPPAQALDRDAPIPLARVVRVELRKMFNTRSGFWLLASLVIVGVLATVGTILVAPDDQLTHNTFAAAIGFPMTIVLPIIAILSITGEWSQRTGLTTFTLVPHRGRVLVAKTIASVVVGIAAMLVALVVGVVGNVVGTTISGTDLVWDLSAAQFGTIVVGSLLCLLTGTMLGMLIRNSPGALVTYFVMTLVLPTLFGILAANQADFADVRPWVDAELARSFLFEGPPTGEQWGQVATTALLWLVLPALVGLRFVVRSEVK
ncbi:ABC transporter permease subunit [Knoellia aerolata]|uniref:ABC transporter permease n=1 Tax=Knoellia aerolata DSM 18566 TaxID=1385519 RepID=A0A0A0K3J0_9MICO|nr:ABC transporter permease subunit [Knoellia aerolata]KGN42872.1 ABC transporter permease [Knoellia aerolata DSM 18566]